MQDTYTVVVMREPDGRYTASAPALNDCGSFGDTLPEALQMAEEAIAGYLESLREHGWEVPPDNPLVTVDMTECREAFIFPLTIRESALKAWRQLRPGEEGRPRVEDGGDDCPEYRHQELPEDQPQE